VKVEAIDRDLLGRFELAQVQDEDGREYVLRDTGEVDLWVPVPRSHSGWPGYWRRPSADRVAQVRAAVIAESFAMLAGVFVGRVQGG